MMFMRSYSVPELGDAAVSGPAQLLVGELGEPAFQAEPAGAGGGEVIIPRRVKAAARGTCCCRPPGGALGWPSLAFSLTSWDSGYW